MILYLSCWFYILRLGLWTFESVYRIHMLYTHTRTHKERHTHRWRLMHMICKQNSRRKMEMEMKLMKEPKSRGRQGGRMGSNRQKLPTAKMYCRGERGEQEQEQKVQSNRQRSDNCNWRISILSCISACCAISFEYISDQSLADSVCLSVCVFVCEHMPQREGGEEREREREWAREEVV